MKVFGVFINIALLVKQLLAESNPAHGLMRVPATMSKGMHSFNHQRGNIEKWYKYKRFQKIFGGEEVTSIEEFPYMTFMYYWVKDNSSQLRAHCCGATILTANYLLTAAHCVTHSCSSHPVRDKDKELIKIYKCTENDKNKYYIFVGSTVPERALTKAKIKAIHIHPEYQFYDYLNHCVANHDIAIVELRRPLQFNSKISRVQLPLHKFASRTVTMKNCKIIGWGLTYLDEKVDDLGMLKRQLKVARINIIDNQECAYHVNITSPRLKLLCQSTQFCTRDPENIKGSCHGDSGGPIICDGVQVGVMSWGSGYDICVGPNLVKGYSRVDIKMKWIRSIISKRNR